MISKTAGLEDYGAQLGDAAATTVVQVHKRKAGPGHGILQERDRRCLRQAMLRLALPGGNIPGLLSGTYLRYGSRPRPRRYHPHHAGIAARMRRPNGV